MTDNLAIANVNEALESRAFPTITLWNRLEGRPRTTDFKRALKAEVRDALWMLTRQWQMGEFRCADAGSPLIAKVHLGVTRFSKYRPEGHEAEAFETAVPMEAKVESRPINFASSNRKLSLDIRLLMGRHWLKLAGQVGDYKNQFIARYPIQLPDPMREEDAHLCAHEEVWQSFAAVAGRAMDGASLYFYLKGDPARHAYDGVGVSPTDEGDIDRQAIKFIEWFEKLYYQPPRADAWDPSRLEYRFACSAPSAHGEMVYAAEEYFHGRLEWYNFDVDKQSNGLGGLGRPSGSDGLGGLSAVPGNVAQGLSETVTQSALPSPVVFEGMPNTRWWTFEDRKTDFGDVKSDTTDLAKLLLAEFGLVYANDWFLIPHAAAEGSIISIEGLAVTNVFGERFWIEAAGSGADDNRRQWSMFTISSKNKVGKNKAKDKADPGLLLLPSVPKIQEGPPVEEVLLVRDEVANMVWGIEKVIPAPTGAGKPGGEAAIETLNFHRLLLEAGLASATPAAPIESRAKIRYEVMNTVPENWIPFIPVRVENNNREIQLQRAAMPRMLEGDPVRPQKVRPRTSLLREGLDRNPPTAYFLHEEEVPSAGVRVTQSFQRTRWRDGRVFVWLGIRKQTGRSEASSGLAFDRITDVKS
ncbi:MAG: hypothetical protein ACREAB_16125 [Blastocatellia bacterium]